MELVFPRHRRPLRCMLNRHRWETLRTEDAKPYQRCLRCGKDEDETDTYGGTKPGRVYHPDELPRRVGFMLGRGGAG